MGRLRVLFATYPEARIVITHRDPLRVLASFANLTTSLKYMGSDLADYESEVQQFAFGYAYLCQHVTDERKAGKLPEERIIDLRYADLMADPVAAVRSVYERWQIRSATRWPSASAPTSTRARRIATARTTTRSQIPASTSRRSACATPTTRSTLAFLPRSADRRAGATRAAEVTRRLSAGRRPPPCGRARPLPKQRNA